MVDAVATLNRCQPLQVFDGIGGTFFLPVDNYKRGVGEGGGHIYIDILKAKKFKHLQI
jgi:hypothetical protein